MQGIKFLQTSKYVFYQKNVVGKNEDKTAEKSDWNGTSLLNELS